MPDISKKELENLYLLLHCSGNYKNPWLHYHDAYEIVILESGERSYIVEDQLLCLKPRDVLLIRKNEIHGAIGGKYTFTNLAFKEAYFTKFFSTYGMELITKCFDNRLVRVEKNDFERLLSCSEKISNDSEDIYSLMNIICILENNISGKTTDSLYFGTKITEILAYINEHYATINTLDDICNALYISKEHLCDLFKKHTGTTVMKYITSIKIRASLELLSKTNYTIENVAAKCGFNSPSYFCKVFKSITGVSPAQYKRMSAVNNNFY